VEFVVDSVALEPASQSFPLPLLVSRIATHSLIILSSTLHNLDTASVVKRPTMENNELGMDAYKKWLLFGVQFEPEWTKKAKRQKTSVQIVGLWAPDLNLEPTDYEGVLPTRSRRSMILW
jgi:hypothetical protein